jgi:formylglycine-generating enzyme required for sulfatase activity/serine/threonine protein kinase
MALNSYNISDTLNHSRRFLIYRAERLSDGEQVIIKTQDPAVINDARLRDSLRSEAEVALKLDHPNIRTGLGCFEEGLGVYFVARYAASQNLAGRLLGFTPDLKDALAWGRDILSALNHAVTLGEIHCNLNPYNVIVSEEGNIQLIGFGKNREAWKHSEGNFKYTLPILYCAPELFNTGKAHLNSDLYSWAVIMYQILTGQMPWKLDSFSSPEEQKHQSFSRGISMPDEQVMPLWLYSILLSCLKLDPAERPANPAELLEILKQEAPDFAWDMAVAEPEEALDNTFPAEITPQEAESESDFSAEESTLALEPIPPETEALRQAEPDFTWDQEIVISDIHHEPDAEFLAGILERVSGEVNRKADPRIDEKLLLEHHPDAALIQSILKNAEEQARLHALSTVFREESRALEDESLQAQEEIEPDQDAQAEAPQEVSIEETAHEPETPAVTMPEDLEASPNPEETYQATETAEPDEQKVRHTPVKPKLSETVYEVPEEEEHRDLGTMKRIFQVLMILSLLIAGYIAVEQFILKKSPQLIEEEPEIDIEIFSEAVLEENLPLEMVLVPADTLVMGSIAPEAKEDEFPLLTIPLRSFMISPTEISQKEWKMVFEDNPSLFRGDDLPVENVSFYDVIEYCNLKSKKDGLNPAYDYYGTEIVCDFDANGYRLPTEAEWELAAKSGVGKSFIRYSGSDDPDEVAWYSENSSKRTHPVGIKKPNELGIFDMSGNVYEWVWNWYNPYSYRVPNLYTGPESGTDKVIRGGSWYHNELLLRNTARNFVKPFVKNGYIGFRLVRSR